MIKHICDNCKNEDGGNEFPQFWVPFFIHQPERTIELHFCSWECLAVFRKKHAKKPKRIA
ncbi:hypothetical protein C8J48_2214 [Desmospora activa DSM 45169]|uniref:MYM-type domain-containing protein n=1 Tax=Desmospora activa DSM 45169 TaxID=1121389 RepID=A0A2T4ZCG4_9BACL|nr:hypothetical protein C8J48_2214 [Desmospora activa DSM 45169]